MDTRVLCLESEMSSTGSCSSRRGSWGGAVSRSGAHDCQFPASCPLALSAASLSSPRRPSAWMDPTASVTCQLWKVTCSYLLLRQSRPSSLMLLGRVCALPHTEVKVCFSGVNYVSVSKARPKANTDWNLCLIFPSFPVIGRLRYI